MRKAILQVCDRIESHVVRTECRMSEALSEVARAEVFVKLEIAAAIAFVHRQEGMVIEGSAALPVAAVLRRPEKLRGKRVVVVITGSRLDDKTLRSILGGEAPCH